MPLHGSGAEPALYLAVVGAFFLILTGVIVYKRRRWRRAKKVREAQGTDFAPYFTQRASANRRARDRRNFNLFQAVHRPLDIDPETNDPDLPVYQNYNPQDQAEQLSKVLEEIKRLESLHLSSQDTNLEVSEGRDQVESQGIARFETMAFLEDLRREAAVLEAQIAAGPAGGGPSGDIELLPRVPPPTYTGTPRSP